jgi:hypothetical protein
VIVNKIKEAVDMLPSSRGWGGLWVAPNPVRVTDSRDASLAQL